MRMIVRIACGIGVFGLCGGCAGNARVEMSAADSMEVLAAELSASVEEYHADLSRIDSERERAAVYAFVGRVQGAGGQTEAESHAEALLAAMEKVRADRAVATERYMNARDNVAALAEVAGGLRRVAVESMSIDDEMKRYLGEWGRKKGTEAQRHVGTKERQVEK